jgi:hypothetical protein
MLRRPRAATAAGFSDDGVAQRVPGGLHALDGQDIAVQRIHQFQKTLDIFI